MICKYEPFKPYIVKNLIMLKYCFFILVTFNCFSQSSFKEKIDSTDNSKRKIFNIYETLLADKTQFDNLAISYSEDAFSALNKGVLTKMKIESFDETFAYYGKKLKIGEFSTPFETIFGWHIIKLLDIDKTNLYSFQHILITSKE
jgi:parvulin-like peptidyl-prolyl isomerase